MYANVALVSVRVFTQNKGYQKIIGAGKKHQVFFFTTES